MGRSDRHVENARMNPANQAWQALDPAAGSLPGEIESALGDGDSVSACVVILVDSEIDRDWGAQASLAVAKRWAASGRRVILADACLDGPVLHKACGVENGEGVSDLVLYGASAQRITANVEGGLVLAPAGTPVVQVADVLKHVKWDMVIRGCREAGATLVFHVSTGTPGAEAVTKRAEGVLVLAPPAKDVGAILGSESGPLMAVLGPANGDAPSVESDGEGGGVASVEALPGLPEVEVPPAAAPDAPPAVAVGPPPMPSDAFSLAGLKGAQYDTDSPDVGLEEAKPPPSPPDEMELGEPLDIELTALVHDGEESAAAVEPTDAGLSDVDDIVASVVGAVADSAPDAAVGLGQPASGAPAEMDAEHSPAEVVAKDSPAEVGVEDAAAGIGVEDSPADAGAKGSPAGVGVEAPPPDVDFATALAAVGGKGAGRGKVVSAEKRKETAKAVRKARRSQKGLTRLRWKKRRDVLVRLVLITLAAVTVFGGTFFGIAYFITVEWITPPDNVRVTSYYAPTPVDFIQGLPTPQSEIMTHVLLLDLWFEVETPMSTAAALKSQLPDLLFFVTPLEIDGTPQFALYAGPAYTAEEAIALRDPVAAVMSRGRASPLNPDDLAVREAQYAFYFSEFPSAEVAQGRIDALALASIPAYALHVTYADSTTSVRVYGGAFQDEESAEVMGRMITDDDRAMLLTPRRGTVPE